MLPAVFVTTLVGRTERRSAQEDHCAAVIKTSSPAGAFVELGADFEAGNVQFCLGL